MGGSGSGKTIKVIHESFNLVFQKMKVFIS